MSTIVGPWWMWKIKDPSAGDPIEADIHRPIRTLHDHAIEDWKKERQVSDEALDFLLGGGGPPSVTFPELGATVLGRVLKYEMAQQIDFVSKKPAFWEDGNPKMQAVVTLQVEEFTPQDEDDVGHRRLYVKGNMRDAIKQAIHDSGFKGASLVGGRLWVQYQKNGTPSQVGLNPPKEYKAKFQPPTAAEMLDQADGPERVVPPQTATWPEPSEAFSDDPF